MSIETVIAYAYSPRHGAVSTGAEHLVLKQDLSAGRLKRKRGDALCKPADKFWGLEVFPDQENRTRQWLCKRCAELAEKLDI